MRRLVVNFKSNEQVSLFTNTVLNDSEHKEVIELFPSRKETTVVCAPRLQKYDEVLAPSVCAALLDCGLDWCNWYELL